MYFELANLLAFALIGVAFVALNLVIAKLLRPKLRVEGDKLEIYECGEPTVGQAWVRFDIRFYTVALMFVVFDVEVALLFPWGVIFRDLAERGLGMLAFVEAGAFIVVLMVGLAYVWARGDIDWAPERPEGGDPATSDFARRSAVRVAGEGEAELALAGASAESNEGGAGA
ncbi:MAG: NADH-quinone oxidoreductase subunit A [Planctomycetes bacterium]|nr:NADH-quinone oxidoreductase subunit A [Planctomycetota bacterium]MCB9830651.1 NADH-quinone oxidoreductase subunit A [Planctomycetota bacterium]